MCGIFGIFNVSGNVKEALSSIKERGRDCAGICNEAGCHYSADIGQLPEVKGDCMAHLLHSVVGCVRQPIRKKGLMVANCEIYNWRELRERHGLGSQNDAELIIDLIEKKGISGIESTLNELDGVYAVAYWHDGKIYLMRDIMGVKPLWYSSSNGFIFASERKALIKLGFLGIEELNPRTIIIYDMSTKEIRRMRRPFIRAKADGIDYASTTKKLIIDAVRKRIPDGRFGILFSGGVDSTLIAKICKDAGADFICYAAGVKAEREAEDITYSRSVAAELGFKLKTAEVPEREVESYLKKVVPLIEDSNVVKVGVGMTFYAACELAKKDGIKVIFSGLGSEEIFAGYERHRNATDINAECISGLLRMYERDLYRDDVISMRNCLELRLPYLDRQLVEYALGIPQEMKISGERNKAILRDIAGDMGIPKRVSERKKRAAQYGSRFDKAIERLARSRRLTKSAYLDGFYMKPNVRIASLWSTGKDSAYASWLMRQHNYEIACIVCLKSSNPESYMFHTPNVDVARLHAESMGVPLVMKETKGRKEGELDDLKSALSEAKERYKIEGVVSGAIFSNYQRERIERVCDELELKIFSPLWHKDQESLLREIIENGFDAILVSVAADGLTKEWLGKSIDYGMVKRLKALKGINLSGEGGEYDSLVLKCPLFSRPIKIKSSGVEETGSNSARLIVKASL